MGGQNRPLKVAIVLDRFLPERGGERYFSFLASALAERGHDVHVFATEAEGQKDLPYKVHLIRAGMTRAARLRALWRLDPKRLAGCPFDVVHAVAHCRAATVLNPHGGAEPAYLRQEFASIESPAYRAYRRLRRCLSPYHRTDAALQARLYREGRIRRVIAISNMVKKDVIDHYGFPGGRIDVVFNAVDLARFSPEAAALYRAETRAGLGVPADATVLLFAGNNFRLKGLATLIRALAMLAARFPAPDLRLVVAGRGRVRTYRRLAARLGIAERVVFAGPQASMERCYGAGDIYVHPTFYDSCSLTVLEALASGLPVVTTRFNGAADVIATPEGGTVVDDPQDAGALASAIAFYLEPERRAAARTVARAWMEAYPTSRNVEETEKAYYASLEI